MKQIVQHNKQSLKQAHFTKIKFKIIFLFGFLSTIVDHFCKLWDENLIVKF
jgi:hypothetical protein